MALTRTQVPFFGKKESRLRRAAEQVTRIDKNNEQATALLTVAQNNMRDKARRHAANPRRVSPIRRNAQ